MDKSETIEYRKSPRWFVVVLVLFLLFIFIGVITNSPSNFSMAFLIFIILCAGIPVYISNKIILDDSSIVFIKDLINTKEVRVPYSKIISVKVDWVWANGGDILISTDGRDYRCKGMDKIEDLQQKLNERIKNSLINAKSSLIDNTQRNELSVQNNDTDELEKLASLKSSGALSDDEYNTMKQKIINR
jgi:uncharacterized membrane protein YdbT with pleckstrin-like domain